jgi:hypothetical protein
MERLERLGVVPTLRTRMGTSLMASMASIVVSAVVFGCHGKLLVVIGKLVIGESAQEMAVGAVLASSDTGAGKCPWAKRLM